MRGYDIIDIEFVSVSVVLPWRSADAGDYAESYYAEMQTSIERCLNCTKEECDNCLVEKKKTAAASAKKKGPASGGRPRKEFDVDEFVRLVRENLSANEICRTFNMSRNTYLKYKKIHYTPKGEN